MEKILRKYTTIPNHLYVERNADKQLKNIIEEMERPGYVLVSRQMGKTNLLFNAIRKLENKDRIFAYVDLSNLFSEEIECYRNIIDSIIEPNEELFGHIESEIYKTRGLNLPPNREYSKSLNILLKEFGGKIIIVLDEIDALRSINYSDHIFAQIRSTYFARTKQPIFNKLSYILSGVIEPTELIKDRNKSPFNIGEKIYLDDFTFEEHNDFIEKSKLKVSNTISKFIYSWTNGNPRLTF
ncbi:MAG: AAA-like domain-containing protein [Aliarcobacter sp.]|nr:AAA-like domain-containing protein [Aliarcobacter sp.]